MNQADEQSAKRSSSVTLNVVLGLELLEHERVRQAGRAPERAERALEPPLPRVRAGERPCSIAVMCSELRERAQALTVGRRLLDRPRECGERPPARPKAHLVRVEDGLHLVPERARLAGAAFVGGRFAHEIQPLERPGARGVEEIAVTTDGVGALQAGAAFVESAASVVVEERRRGAAPRQAPLFQAEHEDASKRRVRARRRSRTATRPGSSPLLRPQRLPLERRGDILARELAGELLPAVELGEQARQCLVRLEARAATSRRRAAHRARRRSATCERRARGPPRPARRSREAPPGRGMPGRAASRPPRGRAPGPGRRGHAAAPRRSRRNGARARRTASAGR